VRKQEPFKNSNIQIFKQFQKFKNSKIQKFKNSKIQKFKPTICVVTFLNTPSHYTNHLITAY